MSFRTYELPPYHYAKKYCNDLYDGKKRRVEDLGIKKLNKLRNGLLEHVLEIKGEQIWKAEYVNIVNNTLKEVENELFERQIL